jgi:hypothetical protein
MVGLGLKHGMLPGPNGSYVFVCVGCWLAIVKFKNTSMFEVWKNFAGNRSEKIRCELPAF